MMSHLDQPLSSQHGGHYTNSYRGVNWVERRAEIPRLKQQICELAAAGLFRSEIGQQLDIGTRTIRSWCESDPDFEADLKDAEEAWMDQVEKSAVQRAKDGFLEVVVSKGEVVMDPRTGDPLMQRRFSDGLMMFVLKGRRRDVYGDKQEIDQKMTIDITGAKDALNAKFLALSAPSPALPAPEYESIPD